jgi:rRNA-processing protein FCF1
MKHQRDDTPPVLLFIPTEPAASDLNMEQQLELLQTREIALNTSISETNQCYKNQLRELKNQKTRLRTEHSSKIEKLYQERLRVSSQLLENDQALYQYREERVLAQCVSGVNHAV